MIVEFAGLRAWTPRMVADSVARFAPGVPLSSASCAIVLRDSVGFADAASLHLIGRDSTWVLLPVVEPAMRDRVRLRRFGPARPEVREWAEVFALLREHPRAMNPLQQPRVLFGRADTAFRAPIDEPTLRLRALLRRHATPRDWERARSTLLEDGSATNRAVAALVLSNFGDRDGTYHALAEGLRTHDMGASIASAVLSALAQHHARTVDWAPARDALDALVGGTNPFVYPEVLAALAATRVDPALGRALARRNPGLLLDVAGARHPTASARARRFLVHVSGQDHGRDRAAWERWLGDTP